MTSVVWPRLRRELRRRIEMEALLWLSFVLARTRAMTASAASCGGDWVSS